MLQETKNATADDRRAPIAPFGREMAPPPYLSEADVTEIRRKHSLGAGDKLATLIIGLRLVEGEDFRVDNLKFLMRWINRHYRDLFDILIVEQDKDPKFPSIESQLEGEFRYEFLFNDRDYNRGWGYNAAVKHFTDNSVVALMDTDVLTGRNFLNDIIDCRDGMSFISPYTNVYFTTREEADEVAATLSFGGLSDEARITKPTTITGGVLIASRSEYLRLFGFEQYITYGGEDRSFDVTLLNHCPPEKWRMSDTVYVHMHHPIGAVNRPRFNAVMEHLKQNYQCLIDKTNTPNDFIHRTCPHVPQAITQRNMILRSKSFGDLDLYRHGDITINGLANSVAEIDAGPAIFPPNYDRDADYAANEPYHDVEPDSDKLMSLHNAFAGQRCFIIGNGPSLNKHDLNLIRNEFSFGVNSFYYKTRETGFKPTFYVVEDTSVMKENLDEIKNFDAPFKFFPTLYKKMHGESENTYFFRMNRGFYEKSSPNFCVPRFSTDASKVLYCGQSVTYINLQLAFFMGFTEIYLIGMDFDYVIPDTHTRKGDVLTSTTDDPNHFHKDYFGVGKTWKDPKLDRVAMNYRQAKISYEAVGRKIYNATVGGKLEIFERVDYYNLLKGTPTPGAQAPTDKTIPQSSTTKVDDSAMHAERVVTDASSPEDSGAAPAAEPERARQPLRARVGAMLRRVLGLPPLGLSALVGAAVAVAIALAWSAPGPATVFILAGLGAAALAAVAFLALRLRRHVRSLSDVATRLAKELEQIHALARERDDQADRLQDEQLRAAGAARRASEDLRRARDDIKDVKATMAGVGSANASAAEARRLAQTAAAEARAVNDRQQALDKRVEAIRTQFSEAIEAQRRSMDDADQAAMRMVEGVRADLSRQPVEAYEALRAEIKATREGLEQRMHAEMAEISENMESETRSRVDALAERLERVDQMAAKAGEVTEWLAALEDEFKTRAAKANKKAKAARAATEALGARLEEEVRAPLMDALAEMRARIEAGDQDSLDRAEALSRAVEDVRALAVPALSVLPR